MVMVKAIFYKEWIKTRWFLLGAILILWAFAAFAMLNIDKMIDVNGAQPVWEFILSKDATFLSMLTYIPLLLGVLLGVFQYVPEMQRKCLKLTLHLPFATNRMMFCMVFYGLAVLLVVYIPAILTILLGLNSFFASEMTMHMILSLTAPLLAGFLGYVFASWITLEPTWKMRILNILISAIIIKILFMGDYPEAYDAFSPIIIIFTLLSTTLVLLSVSRFKEGKQD